jgi:NDP-sugar pyrophosphorylase family protein
MTRESPSIEGIRAVILGAGRATRLQPLVFDRAKPFMTVGGISLVEAIARLLARAGFQRASIVVPDLEAIPPGTLDRVARVGIELEPWSRAPGRSGSLPSAAQTLQASEESLLVVYGDSLLEADIATLLARHRTTVMRGGCATMLLHRPVDLRKPDLVGRTYHGIATIDEATTIRTFVEKPPVERIPPEGWANAAVFVCERRLIADAGRSGAQDFSRDVFEPLVAREQGGVDGCLIGGGYRLDIGSVSRLFEANMACLTGALAVDGLPFECADGLRSRDGFVPARWYPPVILGSAVEIDRNAAVGPRVVVGDRCRIRAGAAVRDSVILDDCEIGPDAKVEGAILGAGTMLGPGVTVPSGSVTGPLTRVGFGTTWE